MSLLRVDASKMTMRARAFLLIRAAFHGGIGLFALLDPDVFDAKAYDVVRLLPLPFWLWGATFVIIAAYLIYSAFTGSVRQARTSLILSAASVGWWGLGFLCAMILLGVELIWLPLSALSLVAIDLVMCANPMRSPFEQEPPHPHPAG